MADKSQTIRNVLVILTAVLMITVTVLQWMEIEQYNIKDHIVTTIKELFVPAEQPAAPAAAPAAAPEAAAPAAPAEAPAP